MSVSITSCSKGNRIIDQSNAPAKLVEGAKLGIEHELERINERKEITIEFIEFTHADSTPETVAYAACLAVREALQLSKLEYPKFDGREIKFKKDK